ncbi:hypothetical protein ZIOFF_070545 [Zingiber officinale]|uniref:Uncharacterized protein n=1 Tax=Zingiber officinale TaxID=94328 RepID=A0A8J5BZY9_ZINOF|nr:hypothetical protein ZIOFF_070545 [Zingiber officinale]
MASSAVIVFLKDERLRQLAQLIRNHEVNNLYHITFQNLGDQLEYLRMSNNNMTTVNTLLDNCNAIVIRYKDDAVRRPIAEQILAYTEHCLNNTLQLIRNYTLRRSYLDKMTDHQLQLFQALEELDTSSGDAVLDFTESIQEHDRLVMSYMRLNLNPHASAEFSRYLRNVGIGFDELVRSYQNRLGFTGRFEDLEIEQKLEIIWDVYSSDHPITTATREALVLAAETGGAALEKLVGVAIATQLTGQAATTLFVTAVGLIGGFVGGFILGAVAGFLFDRVFSSGGQAVLPTDGFILYVAAMPNGLHLAKQIAHI